MTMFTYYKYTKHEYVCRLYLFNYFRTHIFFSYIHTTHDKARLLHIYAQIPIQCDLVKSELRNTNMYTIISLYYFFVFLNL